MKKTQMEKLNNIESFLNESNRVIKAKIKEIKNKIMNWKRVDLDDIDKIMKTCAIQLDDAFSRVSWKMKSVTMNDIYEWEIVNESRTEIIFHNQFDIMVDLIAKINKSKIWVTTVSKLEELNKYADQYLRSLRNFVIKIASIDVKRSDINDVMDKYNLIWLSKKIKLFSKDSKKWRIENDLFERLNYMTIDEQEVEKDLKWEVSLSELIEAALSFEKINIEHSKKRKKVANETKEQLKKTLELEDDIENISIDDIVNTIFSNKEIWIGEIFKWKEIDVKITKVNWNDVMLDITSNEDLTDSEMSEIIKFVEAEVL